MIIQAFGWEQRARGMAAIEHIKGIDGLEHNAFARARIFKQEISSKNSEARTLKPES